MEILGKAYRALLSGPFPQLVLPSGAAGRLGLNLYLRARRRPVRFLRSSIGAGQVRDTGMSLRFARPLRSGLYLGGVAARLERLSTDYLLDAVRLPRDARVIDIGANIGEFSLAVLKRCPEARFLVVEPEGLEAECAAVNLGSAGEVFEVVLWRRDEMVSWYSAPDKADSSVFASASGLVGTKRAALALDSLVERLQPEWADGEIDLIKVEAEGAEPEILVGAQRVLERARWVVIDAGPERGLDRASTEDAVSAQMTAAGFVLIRRGSPRTTLLFERRRS